jgi:nicotinate phosphoribosyltransferase
MRFPLTTPHHSTPHHTTPANTSLVECKGEPRIKLSEEIVKVTLPGRKRIYRLYGGPNGKAPLLDYMTLADEKPPSPCCGDDENENENDETDNNGGILCRDPFRQQHRLLVFPKKVKPLQSLVFDGGKIVLPSPDTVTETTSSNNPNLLSLARHRDYLKQQLSEEFSDEVTKYENPTKYDIMVSPKLYAYLHELWEKNAPVPTRR